MKHSHDHRDLSEQVAKKEQRKLKARREGGRSVWYGLGMFGLVGWSIAVPTVIGTVIGIWIDRTWQLGFSGTLTSLFVGVVMGCAIAWYWVKREGLMEFGSDSSNENATEMRPDAEENHE